MMICAELALSGDSLGNQTLGLVPERETRLPLGVGNAPLWKSEGKCMRAVHVRWVGFCFSIGSDGTNGTEPDSRVSQ